MLYIVLTLAFTTMVLFVYGIYNIIFSTRLGVINRLEIYTTENDNYEIKPDYNIRERFLHLFGILGNLFSRESYMMDRQRKLSQAYIFMRVEEFIGLSLLSGLIFGIILFILSKNFWISIIGAIIGLKLPDIFVNIQRDKRMKRLNNQLPEALTIISNGLRVGYSFTQAMSVASTELDSPIKEEFTRVLRDNSIGNTLEEALLSLSDRTKDEDLDMFITALIIQRRVGGNLAEILDSIVNTIRDRVKIRGEIKTLTAQGKMSALIISILPFAVGFMIFIMNPDYILELFKSTFGIIMMISAVVMQIAGIYIIMKMANIEI